MDAGWKSGGNKIGEKSSLLSDNSAASSSEDKSTVTGRDVTCMRRAKQFFFVFSVATTQLARQVQQERTQVVCSNTIAWKRLARRHTNKRHGIFSRSV